MLDHHLFGSGRVEWKEDWCCSFRCWMVKVPCMSNNAADILQLEQRLRGSDVHLRRCGWVLRNHTRCALHSHIPILPWWWEGGRVLWNWSPTITRPSVASHLDSILVSILCSSISICAGLGFEQGWGLGCHSIGLRLALVLYISNQFQMKTLALAWLYWWAAVYWGHGRVPFSCM